MHFFTKIDNVATCDTKKLFSVLVGDGIEERTNAFRIDGKEYQLKLVNQLQSMKDALLSPPTNSGKWDVVFLSGFLGAYNENVDNLVGLLIQQHKAGKLRSVVLTGLIDTEMISMVKRLHAEKVPAAWIPYDYNNPSNHVRKAVGK